MTVVMEGRPRHGHCGVGRCDVRTSLSADQTGCWCLLAAMNPLLTKAAGKASGFSTPGGSNLNQTQVLCIDRE